jgi:hypothetical protein
MPPNANPRGNRLQPDVFERSRHRARPQPGLRFTPAAWAKLLYLRDCGPSEVGGFGITSPTDLLLVEEIQLVRQRCSPVYVSFEDEAVADFFDQQVDRGLKPEQFARIWVHTHPASCPLPSNTDEETFQRVFGRSDWAVMFILAEEGQTYARLEFFLGPGGHVQLPVSVDYSLPFPASDWSAWQEEYQANVRLLEPRPPVEQLLAGEDEMLWMEPLGQEDLWGPPEIPLDAPF